MIESRPGGHSIEYKFHEAEITKAKNDWKAHPNGDVYIQRLEQILGRDPAAELRDHGSELEKAFAAHPERAEAAAQAGTKPIKRAAPDKKRT